MNATLDFVFAPAEPVQDEVGAQVHAQVRELPVVPPDIARVEALLAEELEALARVEQLDRERTVRWAGIGASCDYVSVRHDAVELIVGAAIQATISAATRLLSKPGAPAQLDIEPYRDEHIGERGRRRGYEAEIAEYQQRLRAFSPAHLWRYLSDRYSPARVQEEARERASITIINALDLHRTESIKHVSGRVEVSVHMWSEADHFQKGMRRYSCSATGQFAKLHEAFDTLVSALDIQGEDRTGALLMAQDLEHLTSSNNKFTSRDRDDYPGGLSVVKFNEAIKLYLPAALAQSINVFVSMHGMEYLNEKRSRYRS